VIGLALVAGCEAMKWLVVQTAPTTEKVAPEFNRLRGKRTLIYVWAPAETLWDYPKVRLDLAAYVGSYIERNVKGVTLIDPLRMESYLEQGGSFEVNPAEVGEHFQADMVVHLAVYQFSMRDPRLAHFYRGRIGASVVVHDLSRAEAPERIPLQNVEVAVPEKGPVGLANVRAEEVRQSTYYAFANAVGKKFHEYEREVD